MENRIFSEASEARWCPSECFLQAVLEEHPEGGRRGHEDLPRDHFQVILSEKQTEIRNKNLTCRMFWKDNRLRIKKEELVRMAQNDSLRHLSKLTADPTPRPFPFNFSANNYYLLLHDPEDIKRAWKPDIFFDQAIMIK